MEYYIEIKPIIPHSTGRSFGKPFYYSGLEYNQLQFNTEYSKAKKYNSINNCAEDYVGINSHFNSLKNLASFTHNNFFVEIKTVE